jgi:hypothetical protein
MSVQKCPKRDRAHVERGQGEAPAVECRGLNVYRLRQMKPASQIGRLTARRVAADRTLPTVIGSGVVGAAVAVIGAAVIRSAVVGAAVVRTGSVCIEPT